MEALPSLVIAAQNGDLDALPCTRQRRGNVSIAELLIDYGADVNATTRSSLTPLYNAILGHHTAMVRLLLAQGANVNTAIANGLVPLHLAAMKGYRDIAALLLDNRAQVNAQSRAGRTPLHWAAINGHGAIVQLLLEKGANLEARDELDRLLRGWGESNHTGTFFSSSTFYMVGDRLFLGICYSGDLFLFQYIHLSYSTHFYAGRGAYAKRASISEQGCH